MFRPRTLALVAGGLIALAVTSVAMAHPGGLVDRFDVLARALGVTPDEVEQAREDGTLRDLVGDLSLDDLTEAYEAEADAAIAEALADGSITPEQAERLGELADEPLGHLGGRFRGFGGFDGFDGFDREAFEELRSAASAIEIDVAAVYAEVLGISVSEVEAAIEDRSIRDLLSETDRVVLTAALVDARDAAIDEAVAAGEITTEQAELLREHSFAGFGCGASLKGGFGGRGDGDGFRGRGRFGGFGPFDGPGSEAPDNSNTSISI